MVYAEGVGVSPNVQKARSIRSFGSPDLNKTGQPQELPMGNLPLTGSSEALYYNVHVVGEVNQPGTYRVLPSDRLTDALRYAGGIRANGSQRSVQLRDRESTAYFDLFAYYTGGSLKQNPYLTDNVVIFVPVKKGEIQIEGPVNRPGYYEITRPISLKNAIKMAGGFATGRSNREPIKIIRYTENGEKTIIEIENGAAPLEKTMLKNGDVIILPHILLTGTKFDYNLQRIPGDNIFLPTLNDNIYVTGAVQMPGPYAFQPKFTVQDYIGLAGPSTGANMRRVKILRVDGKKVKTNKNTEVNPGDTIIVYSKSVTVGNFLAWFGTLTSMALTTFVFVDRFK